MYVQALMLGAAVLLSAAGVSAEGKGGCGSPKAVECGKGGWQELGLSAEQKAQLKELRQSHMTDNKKTGEQMRALREAIRNELVKEKPDKSALKKAAAEAGTLAEKLANSRNEHLLKVKTILTAEQFTSLLDKHKMWGGAGKRGAMDGEACCKKGGACPMMKDGCQKMAPGCGKMGAGAPKGCPRATDETSPIPEVE